MSEPKIVVHHREQLSELLIEAAEVEHNLMCCYLYAAWSLKSGEAEGLTEAQAEPVGRWRRIILDVAIDEMAHFASANNLLSAIGARPHVGRPNFPVSPGYHPAEVLVALHPFDKSTIDHFVYLERPLGVDLPDGEAFRYDRSYVRSTTPSSLMPSAQDFETVGGLYRGIREGFEVLAARLGEAALFVGDPNAQIDPRDVGLDGLVAVRDLKSALEAIERIVLQGEGNVDDPESSHYRKFCRVRDELVALTAEDPSFQPARPVAKNPVQRRPPTPDGKTFIDGSDAVEVLDLANALYNHMLRLVGSVYEPLAAGARRALLEESILVMKAVGSVNEVLTQLPATSAGEALQAGMSFAVTREIRVPPAWTTVRVLAERTADLAEGARRLGRRREGGALSSRLVAHEARLAELAAGLDAMAERIQRLASNGEERA